MYDRVSQVAFILETFGEMAWYQKKVELKKSKKKFTSGYLGKSKNGKIKKIKKVFFLESNI